MSSVHYSRMATRRSSPGLSTAIRSSISYALSAAIEAQALAASLRQLTPRSYSIASSQDANPDEVHLTVAVVRYEAFGATHWGAASTWLADGLADGDTCRSRSSRNARFHLPADPTAPNRHDRTGHRHRALPRLHRATRRARRERPQLALLSATVTSAATSSISSSGCAARSAACSPGWTSRSRATGREVLRAAPPREHGAEFYAWLEDGASSTSAAPRAWQATSTRPCRDRRFEVTAAGAETPRIRLKDLRRAGRYLRDVY